MIDFFKNLFPENLYHSYIVEGDPQAVSLSLHQYLIQKGEIQENSPDILIELYDAFSIDDSRKIKEWHSEMGISAGKRICIIGAKFINHDAERTLLKIIEEPAFNTHFFLIVPNSLVLLDTIRSRAHTVKFPHTGLVEEKNIKEFYPDDKQTDFKKIAQEFIVMSPKNRIDFVAKMIKENKDEESSSILRYVAIKFINEVENIIFMKFKNDNKNLNYQFVLGELEKSRDFLNLPGASVKMILENLALVI